jgi:hypothetical protein
VTEGGANTTLLEQSGPVAGLPWLGASKWYPTCQLLGLRWRVTTCWSCVHCHWWTAVAGFTQTVMSFVCGKFGLGFMERIVLCISWDSTVILSYLTKQSPPTPHLLQDLCKGYQITPEDGYLMKCKEIFTFLCSLILKFKWMHWMFKHLKKKHNKWQVKWRMEKLI